MLREDYIKICSVCLNKSFNPKIGVICGITNEPADFKGNCADYKEDETAVKHEVLRENHDKKEAKGTINKGRIALFVVGSLYLFVGFYEAFIILGADIIFGIIDWVVAGVFIGLGIWSYKKASLALIIGLGFYVAIILLLAVIDPITIVQGIILKIIIIVCLVYAISTARADEAKQKKLSSNDDLLDQL